MTVSARCASLLASVMLVLVIGSSAELDATANGRSLQDSKTFSVIAFGDSTTEGWVPTKEKMLPYTTMLQILLQKKMTSKKVTVVNAGLGASVVVPKPKRPDFLSHCVKKMGEAKAQGMKYDWVIIWIGQNDLLLGSTAEQMFKALKPFMNSVVKAGTSLLFVAPVNYKEIAETDPKEVERRKLGKLMVKYASAVNKLQSQKKKKAVVKYLDILENPTTNPWRLSAANYPKIFEEWHLSEDGYKALAWFAYKKIMFKKG